MMTESNLIARQAMATQDNARAEAASYKKTPQTPQAIDKAAKDFEQVFLAQMFQHMFENVETDKIFGGGHAEGMFRSFMIDEYAKQVSNSGRIGLSDQIRDSMLRMQEGH
jgi:flagellar protein FlgJ